MSRLRRRIPGTTPIDAPAGSLAESAAATLNRGGPIEREQLLFHVTMKRRIRPLPDVLHIAVLHGVVMNVVDVAPQIEIVAYRMFPESPLPYSSFSLLPRGVTQARCVREESFDEPPSGRVVRIFLGQRPDAVDVIGQDDDRSKRKWMAPPTLTQRHAENRDAIGECGGAALAQRRRKEVRCSRDAVAAIADHRPRVPLAGGRDIDRLVDGSVFYCPE